MARVKLDKARVLIYDIETSPNLAYTWGKWQQDVIRFEQEWYILCFAYKWLGEKQTYVVALPDFELYKKDPTNDKEVVKKLRELFEEAHIVIAHNGDKFDQKKAQARMLVHGMQPPSPYRQMDTMKIARKYFNFNSNKLDDLGETLGVGRKAETGGFKLWLGCMNGVKSAWDKMKRYNRQDVILLEKIYLAMRGWVVSHPGLNVIEGKTEACPKCGITGYMHRNGVVQNRVTVVQKWKCENCGGHSRARLSTAQETKVKFVN